MKKLIIATIISLFVIGMAVSAYAVDLETGVSVTVDPYVSARLITPSIDPLKPDYRSTTAIAFKRVDGSSPSGWYYNTLADLDEDTGDPDDNKSDVGIGVHSNVAFQISIEKTGGATALDGKVGYYVDEYSAYNYDGTSNPVLGEIPGSGFDGTDDWGTLTSTPTPIYDSGGGGYPDFSMGISFALVPGPMATGSYTTTITYTILPKT